MAGKRKTTKADMKKADKKAMKAKDAKVNKLTEPSKPQVVGDPDDPVTSVNMDNSPTTGAPVQGTVDAKVREADVDRSRRQVVEDKSHSDEAVLAAGLPLECDEGRVAIIAAVSADGASGKVGWVTARRIDAALNDYKGKK